MIELVQNKATTVFTTARSIGNRLAAMNIYLFFGLLFLYQLFLVFQGVDMLDEGFHASSYQQIFNDPESVQYTFLYWLADVVGGAVVKFFPWSGLLGVRIAGAVVSFLTIVVAYRLLRRHISEGPLKLSLVLLALFINNDPKDLYYNNLSALFYVAVAYCMYIGLTQEKRRFILFAGLFAGINIFTRLPNLLGPAIGLSVFYYGFCTKQEFKLQLKNFLLFAAGVVVAMAGMFMLMYALGHLHLFINSIKQLFSISSGAKEDDGLNGSYGPLNIVINTAKQYANCIGSIVSLVFFVVISGFVLNVIKPAHWLIRTAVKLAIALFATCYSLSVIKDGILDYKLIDIFTGLSLAASFFILLQEKNNEIKLIALLGTFILLVHPVGSAVGIYTVEPYSLWLTFPFTIYFLARTKKVSLDMKVLGLKKDPGFSVSLDEENTRLIKAIGLAIIVLTCLVHIIQFPYFYDRHNRFSMTYSIDNKNMKGIYTSKARAESISELLRESAKYIKPNDYVLAYDLIPLYHFWTETKPYVRNPCPWFYNPGVFQNELDLSMSKNLPLPVVVMQTRLTIGDGSKWPEEKLNEDYSKWDRNKGRNKVMDRFLAEHNYKAVWENENFRIMVPGTASATVGDLTSAMGINQLTTNCKQ